MKRILTFILILAIIFAFSGCGTQQKKDVFNLVEKKYDAIVTACENKDTEALLAMKGITKVHVVDGYVIVFCKGAGISASSQDYGFYYSEDNSPVTVGCNLEIVRYAADLSPKGNGYQCVVNYNVFYTEQIKGNIYFYSNDY